MENLDEVFAKVYAQQEAKKREEVASLQAVDLMVQYDILTAANQAVEDAKKTASEAKTKFADMLAAAYKITVGMRVSVTKRTWKRAEPTTTVYEVIGWNHWAGANLTLKGRTVRKDGSLGDAHDISGDWKRV